MKNALLLVVGLLIGGVVVNSSTSPVKSEQDLSTVVTGTSAMADGTQILSYADGHRASVL